MYYFIQPSQQYNGVGNVPILQMKESRSSNSFPKGHVHFVIHAFFKKKNVLESGVSVVETT